MNSIQSFNTYINECVKKYLWRCGESYCTVKLGFAPFVLVRTGTQTAFRSIALGERYVSQRVKKA